MASLQVIDNKLQYYIRNINITSFLTVQMLNTVVTSKWVVNHWKKQVRGTDFSRKIREVIVNNAAFDGTEIDLIGN